MNFENRKKEQTREDVERTVQYIRRKTREGFYGEITIDLSAGWIRRVTTKTVDKPEDLACRT